MMFVEEVLYQWPADGGSSILFSGSVTNRTLDYLWVFIKNKNSFFFSDYTWNQDSALFSAEGNVWRSNHWRSEVRGEEQYDQFYRRQTRMWGLNLSLLTPHFEIYRGPGSTETLSVCVCVITQHASVWWSLSQKCSQSQTIAVIKRNSARAVQTNVWAVSFFSVKTVELILSYTVIISKQVK